MSNFSLGSLKSTTFVVAQVQLLVPQFTRAYFILGGNGVSKISLGTIPKSTTFVVAQVQLQVPQFTIAFFV